MEQRHWDWLRRGVRTFFQAFVAMIVMFGFPIAQSIIDVATKGGELQFDWDIWKRLFIAASLSGGIALVTMIQNALEDNTNMPAVLKDRPSAGNNPTPDA